MSDNLLFYDIEVFAHDSLVVFKNSDKEVVEAMWNQFTGLGDLIKGKTLVGYNNYYYDDFILSKMIDRASPRLIKKLNDKIIRGEQHPNYVHHDIVSLDCFQQIDVAMPGLKKIEGNMGKMILESSVPFDIDRPLTETEKQEVLEYCSYDVDTTIDIYTMREHTYFQSKQSLLNMLNNPKARRWNTTTISANLLLDKPLTKWSGLRVPEEMMDIVHPDVAEMWLERARNSDSKSKGITLQEFDNDILFAFGGLHGAHRHKRRFEDVILLDVASMYPSIIIKLEALGPATKAYKDMRDKRIQIKHTDKPLSDALKLVLNSVYGNLKNQYSMLNNPNAALTVCVYGQIALYDLCRRLAPFSTIVNINTDGVAFTCETDLYKDIWAEWEEDFGLVLEEERFDVWYQKDVNNYVALQDGKVKAKGGDVGRYDDEFNYRYKMFQNQSTRIVDIAMVDNLLYGKDPVNTILENLDRPELFQYILQAGSSYRGTFDTEGRQYNKINRVFAQKTGGVQLQKKRMDGGLVRFPDAPDSMMVWNKSCSDIDIDYFRKVLDINHYYQLIRRKLDLWR